MNTTQTFLNVPGFQQRTFYTRQGKGTQVQLPDAGMPQSVGDSPNYRIQGTRRRQYNHISHNTYFIFLGKIMFSRHQRLLYA